MSQQQIEQLSRSGALPQHVYLSRPPAVATPENVTLPRHNFAQEHWKVRSIA